MRTIVKNNAKALAVALTAAMVLSATAVPTSEAKAKKPKLSTKKVSVEVGAAKKVTVKNAKKVTWSINKAGKKAVALAKKSKKGVTIKGKAVGKAKVTAKMKYGKKTLKKTIKVTVTKKAARVSAATPSATPSATPVNSAKPSPTPAASAAPTGTPTAAPTPDTAPAVYKVDFEKNAYFEGGNAAEQQVAATGATVTFGQFQGIFYALPNTPQMLKSKYAHVYVVGNASGDELKVSFLKADESGLKDPLDTYGRQENELREEVGAITESEGETVTHFTSGEGTTTYGIQIFNWNSSADLTIKAILFSEKELTDAEVKEAIK